MLSKVHRKWIKMWMTYSGSGSAGKCASWLAGLFLPPFYGKLILSRLNYKGYISPKAQINHKLFEHGKHIYIDDRVLIYQERDGGRVGLGDEVHLHRDTVIQTGQGGYVQIGAHTHIQPRCQFSAYLGSISIGANVEIAPGCAFYSYDHSLEPGKPVGQQPLKTKGGIRIDDNVWLGYGVIILDGVHIGEGAAIGAGSVVTKSIAPQVIAAGQPAKVIKARQN
jgi:acetyltransferase-like isoleucine patch superfamily enzyme